MGFNPVWQDIAATDSGMLVDILEQRIGSCDAVIQLVGERFGAEPPGPIRDFGRVSYTQFEALYAEKIGKKVIYIVLPPEFPTDPCEPETEEMRCLQEGYRQELRERGVLRHSASGPVELENRVFRVRDDLAELRRAIEQNRRRMLLLGSLTLLGILAIGILVIRLTKSSEQQQGGIQRVEESTREQAKGLEELHVEERQQTVAVERIEERVREIRALPAALRADRLTRALASAHVEDLILLREAGLNPPEVEIALAQKLPGSESGVASQFFSNSRREPDAIEWFKSILADGVNPNLPLAHSYYERQAIIVSALAAGNAPAAIALLEAGASPHAYQSLWLTSYSIPRFLFPLHYLSKSSRLTSEEKKAVGKAYQAAGVCTFTLEAKKGGYSDYFGQISTIAKSHAEAEKTLGISIRKAGDARAIGGRVVAENAAKHTGYDWGAFLDQVPRKIELDREKDDRCTYFESMELHHLLGVYFDKAYFLGTVPNSYGRYCLVEISKDVTLWNVYPFMPNGPGLGFAKKEREGDPDPDRAWRKFDIKFDLDNQSLLLEDYYHFKVSGEE